MLTERVSPHGLVLLAIDFHCAAVVTFNDLREFEDIGTWPAYSNIGHAIELSAKALLRKTGQSADQLSDIGHRLNSAFEKVCVAYPTIGDAVGRDDRKILNCFDELYRSKDFDYFGRGSTRVPSFRSIEKISRSICTFAICEINPQILRGRCRTIFEKGPLQAPRTLTVAEAAKELAKLL